jgi:hypothetical protein
MIQAYRTIICFYLVLACAEALAYIPKSHTILSRMARTHGKGAFAIDQDVTFRIGAETLTLREKWIVESGDSMRLSVSLAQAPKGSEQTRFEVVYHGDKKTLTDSAGGTIKTAQIGAEFIEGFFHDRSGRALTNRLVKTRIVAPGFGGEGPKYQKIEQIKHQPEREVRLGRLAGVVTWVFGEPTPPTGALLPGAWIEQDAFLLRKLRFPTEAEVTADRYTSVAGSLKFPRERTVIWRDGSASIQFVSARALPAGQASKALDLKSVKAGPGQLPDVAAVREFYSRFR